MSEHNAFSPNTKIIRMTCPGCGAGLEISKDLENFACGYCGSSLHVARSGGTVALSLVDVVDQVRANTDRTASELALVRLAKELEEVSSELARVPLSAGEPIPVPMFGESDGVSELGMLIATTVLAIVVDALTSWHWFLAISAVFLLAVLGAMGSRIKKAKRHNASLPEAQALIDSKRAKLLLRRSAIDDQIAMHRRILNAVERE